MYFYYQYDNVPSANRYLPLQGGCVRCYKILPADCKLIKAGTHYIIVVQASP